MPSTLPNLPRAADPHQNPPEQTSRQVALALLHGAPLVTSLAWSPLSMPTGWSWQGIASAPGNTVTRSYSPSAGQQLAADRSLQLWALPTQGAPQSLGVMGEGRLEQLQAQLAQVQAVPALAISLEPKGGVPSETGPTGPVLFSGALIKRDL